MTTVDDAAQVATIAEPPRGRIWLVRDTWTEATRHLRAAS